MNSVVRGCGSDGRVFTSNTWGPRFESHQLLISWTFVYPYKNEPDIGPSKKRIVIRPVALRHWNIQTQRSKKPCIVKNKSVEKFRIPGFNHSGFFPTVLENSWNTFWDAKLFKVWMWRYFKAAIPVRSSIKCTLCCSFNSTHLVQLVVSLTS